MKLIVGLGNPGIFYVGSRHNIGFSLIKALVKLKKAALKRDNNTSSLSTKVKFSQDNVILAMPLTFMNLSGVAVKQLITKYKIDLADFLLICDDLDLELGRLKIMARGSSGGHRGLSSIINSLGTDNFARLRLGIGRPRRKLDASEYVLAQFGRKEKAAASEMIERAAECAQNWLNEGVTKAMNEFNHN